MSDSKETVALKFDNLGVYARADENEATKGIDVGFPNGFVFTILRAGGANHKYKAAVRKYMTPAILRKVNKDALTIEEDNELWRNIYIDGVIIDVKGVKINGTEMAFTKGNVRALLIAAPDLLTELRDIASDLMSFRAAEVKEVADNLGNSSSGNTSGEIKKST